MIKTFSAETTDDLMRAAASHILRDGLSVDPTRGPVLEVCAVGLELTNPRARLSRSEGRGRVFSCLGELCWYLSGSSTASDVSYYIPAYEAEAEDGVVYGGYGPRLLRWDGINQIDSVVKVLRDGPASRRAVIQLFDHEDLRAQHRDIPCTCTLQFLIRGNRLHLITYMRSNDVYLGLPHDIFSFTMIQEVVARTLGVPLGIYSHFVGSLHVYEHHRDRITAFIREGWQGTTDIMPEMPLGDPWSGVAQLLQSELAIRRGVSFRELDMPENPYWADLVRLLAVYSSDKRGDYQAMRKIRQLMDSPTYDIYVSSRIDREVSS